MIATLLLPNRRHVVVPSIILVLMASTAGFTQAADPESAVRLGRRLFEHKWVVDDPLSPSGDGLGPMHNADSCVACHSLGGVGGAGSNGHNVELLSIAPPAGPRSRRTTTALASKAVSVHPAFSGSVSTVLLHHFSTDSSYERWRLLVLGFKPPADLHSSRSAQAMRAIERKRADFTAVADLPQRGGVPLRLSQRNTTALFGAGLIDSIPGEALLELAKKQPKRFPGIAGRVGRTSNGSMGRFGWRGQVATLNDFVLTACAMELGLQNAQHPQAIDPLDRTKKPGGDDLSKEQCDALVAFVASLPAPRQLEPASQSEANGIKHGEQLFETVGCNACHVRDIGRVTGIYSDLLLHDMGAKLEDPLPAVPERVQISSVSFSGSTGYGGGSLRDTFDEVPTGIRREWKTPPLWGVRDSAPYLHDGRAATLQDAIFAHGGEGEASARQYHGLDLVSRSHVLAFLNTLAAPDLR